MKRLLILIDICAAVFTLSGQGTSQGNPVGGLTRLDSFHSWVNSHCHEFCKSSKPCNVFSKQHFW